MTPDAKKRLIGAVIAAALAIAVYYGLIDQKQADNIRTQADQTLGTGSGGQQQPQTTQPQATQPQPQATQPTAPQQGPAAPQNTTTATPPAPAPQNQAPPPQH